MNQKYVTLGDWAKQAEKMAREMGMPDVANIIKDTRKNADPNFLKIKRPVS